MKLAYILILLVLLFIAGLYVWNTVAEVKRVPVYRADEIRYYPVVEYPIDEYPYYYGWWWPWYGGSYNIVGSRYGSLPPHRDWRHDGHPGGGDGLPGMRPPPGPSGGGGHGGSGHRPSPPPAPAPAPAPAPGPSGPAGGGGHGGH